MFQATKWKWQLCKRGIQTASESHRHTSRYTARAPHHGTLGSARHNLRAGPGPGPSTTAPRRAFPASCSWVSQPHGIHSSATGACCMVPGTDERAVDPAARHGHVARPAPGTGIKVHFNDAKGNLIRTVEGNEGDDLLSIAHEYDIDLEGACEGSVACSTCHVILTPEFYDRLPEPDDEENDMLDMAFGLTDTSRLGCQVVLTRDMDGVTATLPAATRNMFVDGG
ncbi:hypothetical protein H0H81_001826 [Sphagnurus paluster]|uniref:2Fe-2S ferredoxin-type domain-containing protein n=1 Tax=Sphagnurus paluster TaxID=117069 RepID=A0A9P7GMU1_9AGAR|nr:hypothetical protein H0H81_001826 [Sphagnurus paluster]